jgi:outer membrane protein assembly factor BamD
MKRFSLIAIVTLIMVCHPVAVFAYWVWTPESGRWVNPKYAVRDTPEEQFDTAIGHHKSGDHKRAIAEFQKLLNYYPKSELAPSAQYYIGRVYEDMQEYYAAYLAYQKTIEQYPFTEKVDEIVERQYRIGNLFLTGQKAKLLGVALLPALDKAVEIFESIVKNAPYSQYGPLAQFKIGQAYKKDGNFEEAIMAFQKLLDSYPESELVDDAKYEIAYCTYKASLKPHYDQTPTDVAIKQFEEFAAKENDPELNQEAETALLALREKKAKSLFEIAEFYERQRHYQSALVYYGEILEKFSDTATAMRAIARVKILERKQQSKKR